MSALDDNESLCHLKLGKLLEAPKQYGMPRALRRTIESLFKQFISAVANPNIFDLVVDLYDAFSTFYRVLVNELPAYFSNGRMIDAEGVSSIARFSTALQSALDLRLCSVQGPKSRRISVNFPGSFAQAMFSADAALKAGIGILKYHLKDDKGASLIREGFVTSRLDSVGVVCDVSLEAGVRVYEIVMPERLDGVGNPDERPKLTFIRLDLDHLFHVGSYHDFIHESFHLVFDQLIRRGSDERSKAINVGMHEEDELYQERIEEIFVNLLSILYLTPNEPLKLLQYLVSKYSMDITSECSSKSESIRVFAERLQRLSIPAWIVSVCIQNETATQASHRGW
ncbi:MAG: hypothetical protein KDN22_00835, partial [Verrucomicrobiae bacterium]|nr:hypothetical protein [Verrucomicrobiae bacterium]